VHILLSLARSTRVFYPRVPPAALAAPAALLPLPPPRRRRAAAVPGSGGRGKWWAKHGRRIELL